MEKRQKKGRERAVKERASFCAICFVLERAPFTRMVVQSEQEWKPVFRIESERENLSIELGPGSRIYSNGWVFQKEQWGIKITMWEGYGRLARKLKTSHSKSSVKTPPTMDQIPFYSAASKSLLRMVVSTFFSLSFSRAFSLLRFSTTFRFSDA